MEPEPRAVGRRPAWLLPLLIESAVAAVTVVGGLLVLQANLGMVILALIVVYAVAVWLGSRTQAFGPTRQGLAGLLAGIAIVTFGLQIAANLGNRIALTSGLGAVVVIDAIIVGGFIGPGALLGRGLVTARNGMAAVGCLVPAGLVLFAIWVLSNMQWGP